MAIGRTVGLQFCRVTRKGYRVRRVLFDANGKRWSNVLVIQRR
jgi:hypothetical protein